MADSLLMPQLPVLQRAHRFLSAFPNLGYNDLIPFDEPFAAYFHVGSVVQLRLRRGEQKYCHSERLLTFELKDTSGAPLE